jgi:hypothetical protein
VQAEQILQGGIERSRGSGAPSPESCMLTAKLVELQALQLRWQDAQTVAESLSAEVAGTAASQPESDACERGVEEARQLREARGLIGSVGAMACVAMVRNPIRKAPHHALLPVLAERGFMQI